MARVKGPCSLRVILTATLAIILTFLPSISLGAPSKCRSPSATSVPAPTTPSEGNPSSTLPLPFSKSRPPATLHLFENLSRYRTSRANSLVLKFKKQQVAMRSGARFAFSPTWFPTEEMTFSYAFRVANDFNFRLTGKLPGVYFGSCRSCYSSGKVYNKGQGSFRPTWQVKDAKGKWAYNGTPFVEPYIYGAHGTRLTAASVVLTLPTHSP
ncbi:MAG: polysaccharide lyase [bacterium]